MKQALLLLLLLCASFPLSSAQKVYDYVLQSSTNTVNNPLATYTDAQVAQFKRTALVYLKKKCFEKVDTISGEFLDVQAYYLSEFVTLFCRDVYQARRLSETGRKERIMLFMDASVSNPLFDDSDQQTTMAYIIDGNSVMPFCLNTDWPKAYAAITVGLKKREKQACPEDSLLDLTPPQAKEKSWPKRRR